VVVNPQPVTPEPVTPPTVVNAPIVAQPGTDHVNVTARNLRLQKREADAMAAKRETVGDQARITVRYARSTQILIQETVPVQARVQAGVASVSFDYRSAGARLDDARLIEVEVAIPTSRTAYLYYDEVMPAGSDVKTDVPFLLYGGGPRASWPAIGAMVNVAGIVSTTGMAKADRADFVKNAAGEYGIAVAFTDPSTGTSFGMNSLTLKPGTGAGRAINFDKPMQLPEGSTVKYALTAKTRGGQVWQATGTVQVNTMQLDYDQGFAPVVLSIPTELAVVPQTPPVVVNPQPVTPAPITQTPVTPPVVENPQPVTAPIVAQPGTDHVSVTARNLRVQKREADAMAAKRETVGDQARITVRYARSTQILIQETVPIQARTQAGVTTITIDYRSAGAQLGDAKPIEVEVAIPTSLTAYLYYDEVMPAGSDVKMDVPFLLYGANPRASWPATGAMVGVAGIVSTTGMAQADRADFVKNAAGEYSVTITLADPSSGKVLGTNVFTTKPGSGAGSVHNFGKLLQLPEGATVKYTLTAKTRGGQVWQATGTVQVNTLQLDYNRGFAPVVLTIATNLAVAPQTPAKAP
jgi:head-tail adaptor